MEYIIKNKKYNVYYGKNILGVKHFTTDIGEAMRFENKKEVNLAMRLFKHKDNFETIKIVK